MMDLHDIQRIQVAFQAIFDAYPAGVTLAYAALFTLITALCLPGAAVLMLLAGASFGLVWGSVLAAPSASMRWPLIRMEAWRNSPAASGRAGSKVAIQRAFLISRVFMVWTGGGPVRG